MKTTMFDRLLGDEPTGDPAVRWGRLIGTVLGLALYPIFVWLIIDGFSRFP